MAVRHRRRRQRQQRVRLQRLKQHGVEVSAEDYHQMFDCVVSNGIYSIHPFALPENKGMVVEKLTELAGDLEVKTVERYCNTAFYSYLKGEDYQ